MRTKYDERIVTCIYPLKHPTRLTENIFILNRNYQFEYRKIGGHWWYVILDYKTHYTRKIRHSGLYTSIGPHFEINVFLTHEEFEKYFRHYDPHKKRLSVFQIKKNDDSTKMCEALKSKF